VGDLIEHRVMNILVACEYSGVVRDAFIRRGHNAISCDILPTDSPGPHHQGDVLQFMDTNTWDLMIAFPPCTYLCCSGLHWNKSRPERQALTESALVFVQRLLDAPIPKIALENPVGCISSRIRKPNQIIHPWQYGDDAAKRTCLWLKNLPELCPTEIIKKERYANQTVSGHNKLGSKVKNRAKLRSLTYPGIANAMADQWG
jgi:hypothetical protein